MSPEDEKRIAAWERGLSRDISFHCVWTNDTRSDRFKAFCEALSRLAPRVTVTYQKGDDAAPMPALDLDGRIVYHAVPEGPELAPFLEALSLDPNGPAPLSQAILSKLAQLKAPCLLKLFIAPQCPFCPKSVQDLTPLAWVNEWVKLTVVDGLLFPEMARPLKIQSAPTLVFDDRMQWTGQTPIGEILDVIASQDPSLLSATSMERLLGDGKASDLARMMRDQGTIFPVLYDLLTHEKWPIRLGAMVVMEDILEQDRMLAQECVNPLWERFSGLDAQAQGDVLYILGEVGTPEIVPYLEGIVSGPYSAETREAAEEAMETITQRHGP